MARSKMVLGLVASAIALTSSAVAQAPLAKGEALFELQATGRVVQKADHIEVTCKLNGIGFTKDEALADLEKAKAGIVAPLRALGVAASAITYPDLPRYDRYHYFPEADELGAAEDAGIMASKMGDVAPARAPGKKAAPKKKRVAYEQSPTIRLTSLRQNDEVDNALTEAGCESPTISRFSIDNMPEAQLKAKDLAIGEARKEAERYAANLGLKVLRIVRVSEYSPISAIIGADTSQLISGIAGAAMDYDYARGRYARRYLGLTDDPDAYVTWKTLWVDFVLGPK